MPGPLSNTKGDRTVFIDRRLDIDPAYRLSRLRNRLDAVDQQVDDHLLQLNPVAYHAGSVEPNAVDTVIHVEKIARDLEAQYVVCPNSPN